MMISLFSWRVGVDALRDLMVRLACRTVSERRGRVGEYSGCVLLPLCRTVKLLDRRALFDQHTKIVVIPAKAGIHLVLLAAEQDQDGFPLPRE